MPESSERERESKRLLLLFEERNFEEPAGPVVSGETVVYDVCFKFQND